MAKNIAVFGLYPARESVEQGVDWLRASGFRSTDVSVLFPENTGSKDLALRRSSKAPEGATAGAGSGALIGGTLGWLAGIGTLAIPGLGPFIAAGPIIGLLAGLGAGGAVGGIVGGLIGMGIPEYEAKRYEGRIRRGGILLSVHCDNSEWASKARMVLEQTGAEDISSASEEKADFATSVKPLPRSRAATHDDHPPVRVGNLFVREVMTPHVETVDADAPISEAAAKMRRSNIGFLPVQSGNEIVGLVSNREIPERISAVGYDPSQTNVRAVMTSDYAYCFDNQEALEAAKILENRQLRVLLVLDHEKRLVGMLSAEDVAGRIGDERLAGRLMRRPAGNIGSEPPPAHERR